MHFLRPPRNDTRRIALFAGAFHPPTLAHAALADAAKVAVEETLWVLPRSFPHKQFDAVSLEQRCEMLLAAGDFPVAIADSNYFFAMAEELRSALPAAEVHLLLGEDGAERLFTWDYGLSPAEARRMLLDRAREFPLLAARRHGERRVPPDFASLVRWLDLPDWAWTMSSTQVRAAIAAGAAWEHWVAAGVRDAVARYYGSASN